MPLDYARLKDWREPPVRHAWVERDANLYALGLNVGANPLDRAQLQFACEGGRTALPTLATVLAPNFGWLYRTQAGIDPVMCVHGEQSLRLHRPLPVSGEAIGELRITHIVDKGLGKGAVVYFERTLRDASDGALLATLGASMFCRGHGGFDGPTEGPPGAGSLPAREADARWEWPTLPQQALLYRQSGDLNPLHSDPAIAAAAGFPRPILHGLCTFGIASCMLLKERLGWDAGALRFLHARFVAPLYPGETVVMEFWEEAAGPRFRCSSKERGVVALDKGVAQTA